MAMAPMRDFEFGFDDKDFSDRVLRIEIIPDGSLDCEVDDVKVKTLHINSLLLAEKSLFFYKLFKSGMRESQQNHVTLNINASEEAALIDLLRFTYRETLSTNTVSGLVGVLMVADRFRVVSCMKLCSDLLLKLHPMSLESARLYLELPSSILMAEEVKPLQDAAEQYIDRIYKLQKEAMTLSLSEVEDVLSSDDLRVPLEDDVLDFMVRWVSSHYPNKEERREILSKRLVQFLRFSYLSRPGLKKVLANPEFNQEQVQRYVREALFVNAGMAKGQCTTNQRFIERAYKHRPIKVVHFEFPWPCCVDYFDLKKDECVNLSLSNGPLASQQFFLDGRVFILIARCVKEQYFGLFLYGGHSEDVGKLDFEFEVMKRPSKEFESVLKINGDYTLLTPNTHWTMRNLFIIAWSDFIAEDSEYFIDGIVHLRVLLTIKDSEA